MTGRRLIVVLALILGLTAHAGAASVPLIVEISPNSDITSITTALRATVLDSMPDANTYLLDVPAIPLDVIAAQLGILSMEVNSVVTLPRILPLGVIAVPSQVPADWYKYQPSMWRIRGLDAQRYSTGRGVVVADINSKVDVAHPALIGHLTTGYDFVTGRPAGVAVLNQSSSSFMDQSSSSFMDQSSSSFMDQSSSSFMDQSSSSFMDSHNPAYSHGTLTVGVIAMVAPDSMIMPLRVFDDEGSADIFNLAKAIRYAVQHGAQVVNMSFGTLENAKTLRNAVNYARNNNVVLVASAGNNNTSAPQYPAAYSGILTTAATDIFDGKGSFSNYGSYVVVDAPGVNVFSTYPGGYYSIVSGTSFSAPAVAGTAALVRSLRASGVANSITGTAVNIDFDNPNYVNQLGYGRIDVLRAVKPN